MTLHRTTFLTLSSVVALAIGTFAFVAPEALLESKGVTIPNSAAALWVREVGLLIFALGLIMFLVRRHPDSPTLRAVLLGNAVVQIGLFPIEIVAYRHDVITLMSGIVPNSVVHALLAVGFLAYALRIKDGARRDGLHLSKSVSS
jgi:hypothetical protein